MIAWKTYAVVPIRMKFTTSVLNAMAKANIWCAWRCRIPMHRWKHGGSEKPAMTIFEQTCVSLGLQAPVAEFVFAPPRKWRFDWAFESEMVALEIEGGVWTRGRHTRGKGFLGDMAKYNAAACLGWRIIRTTPTDFANGSVFDLLLKAMPKHT